MGYGYQVGALGTCVVWRDQREILRCACSLQMRLGLIWLVFTCVGLWRMGFWVHSHVGNWLWFKTLAFQQTWAAGVLLCGEVVDSSL